MTVQYDNNGNPYEGNDDGDFIPPDPNRRAWYMACAVVFVALCCILALPQIPQRKEKVTWYVYYTTQVHVVKSATKR